MMSLRQLLTVENWKQGQVVKSLKNYTTTKNLQVRQRRLLDMPRSFSDDNEAISKKYTDDKAVS